MFDRLDDTIVAVSSPPGSGVRGVLRLSGPHAIELASDLFTDAAGTSLDTAAGHRRLLGSVRLDRAETSDGLPSTAACVPTEAYIFRAPASYTRQDLVELHVPGSPPVLAMILEQLTVAGARPAEPGEFTGRAFLAGAMDLTRVEGVAAMIHAQTDAQMRASEALLHGALSRQTQIVREELTNLLALIEAEIDFSEEPIEFVSLQAIAATLDRATTRLHELIGNSESAEVLDLCPRVVLVGLPNAGKSTLFNALTGVDRAIQSATAGTTRDVVTAPLRLAGGEVLLCDTAGASNAFEQDQTATSPECDAQQLTGQIEAATARAIASADVIVLVLDASSAPTDALTFMSQRLKDRSFAVVLNKIDCLHDSARAVATMLDQHVNVLAQVSAITGANVAELLENLDRMLFSCTEKQAEATLSLSNRQRGALHDACDALQRARGLIDAEAQHDTAHELLAMELRGAVHALSLLLGDITSEDLLARIFARFCIGK